MARISRTEAHRQFLELVSDFYRETQGDLSWFASDPDSPVAFDVRASDVTMSVGYDPHGAAPSLFVYCVFGAVPPHEPAAVLHGLFARNLALSREHEASFCIDPGTGEVALYVRCRFPDVDGTALRERIAHVAQEAAAWHAGGIRPAPIDRGSEQRAVPWVIHG